MFLMMNGLVYNASWALSVCLLCRECVSVFKEYNLKRPHQTKHLDFGHNLTFNLNEERKRNRQELVYSLKKQKTVFTKQSLIQDAATEASLVLFQKIFNRNKSFSYSEFIKKCLSDAANIMCPEQKTKFDSISSARRTVVRRVEKLVTIWCTNIEMKSKTFAKTSGVGRKYLRTGRSTIVCIYEGNKQSFWA